MVIEIWFNFQICVQCAEKAITKITFKFSVRGTAEYQRVTSQGLRTMGSEWPDKLDKTGFGSMELGVGFHMVILPRLTVGSVVVWVTGLFYLCRVWPWSQQPHQVWNFVDYTLVNL